MKLAAFLVFWTVLSVIRSNDAGAPTIPTNAISSGILDDSSKWAWTHDAGTPGSTSNVASSYISSTMGRQFQFDYEAKAGERFHISFGTDTASTHFCYALEVYFEDPTQIQNLELDMNQVTSDGRTVIWGTQASSDSGSWEYTYITGTATHWNASNIKLNPRNWSAKTWHSIAIYLSRVNNDGILTYTGVEFDGTWYPFTSAPVFSADALGWAMGALLINVQIDGYYASGTVNMYARNIQVSRWTAS